MDSPRSGFRRANATSWTFAGIGITGVVGASALAYADTEKPAAADLPAVVESVVSNGVTVPVSNPPSAADAPTLVSAPPPPASQAAPVPVAPPEPVGKSAPVEVQTASPRYTPEPRYAPEPTYQQPPATHQVQPSSPQSTFPIRTSHTSTSGGSPNFTPPKVPHVTRSRGS
jgi:hypothetical protein